MAALVRAAGEHPEVQSDTWSAFNPYPCERARADLRMGRNIMNRRTTLVLAAALLVVPAFAADPSGFALWKSAELKQRDEALSKKVGPDHSARETLADYNDHRFRMLYRDADGFPEQHDNVIDVVIVQSGEGTLVVGGKMINPKGGGGAGEYLGTSIEGGERHPLGPGDIVHIPAKIPHSFLVPTGKHIAYALVKFPAQ
jgi:mannose-6-phosphate isomerase-like protein (cupin superfamily)